MISFGTRIFREAEHRAERLDSTFIVAMPKVTELNRASIAALRKQLQEWLDAGARS